MKKGIKDVDIRPHLFVMLFAQRRSHNLICMRILIIDDDTTLLNSLRLSLESESYAVDTCSDGETGSYFARTNEYDVIILDVMLPKKTGHAVCAEIRDAGRNTPIIGLSIIGGPSEAITFLERGGDDYLAKPFSFHELRARIRCLIRRPHVLINDILTIDTLTVNAQKHTVMRGSEYIYLTRKEFALLEFMMRNKQHIVSRGMIMEHVWNIDSDPFSNTIEAHILNLRRKIERKDRPKLIHNIPGRGYTIDDCRDDRRRPTQRRIASPKEN